MHSLRPGRLVVRNFAGEVARHIKLIDANVEHEMKAILEWRDPFAEVISIYQFHPLVLRPTGILSADLLLDEASQACLQQNYDLLVECRAPGRSERPSTNGVA